MIDVNIPNVVTIVIVSLLGLAAVRWVKRATGLPLPV